MTMEQRMSALRASYLLNQEKLLYTHHVLTQRASETRTLVPQLKHHLIEQGRILAELRVGMRMCMSTACACACACLLCGNVHVLVHVCWMSLHMCMSPMGECACACACLLHDSLIVMFCGSAAAALQSWVCSDAARILLSFRMLSS